MEITRKQTVADNKYKVVLLLSHLSEADAAAISRYQGLTVDAGGEIPGPPAFSLATDSRRIVTAESITPLSYTVDLADYADAAARATAWGDEMVTRIKAAIDTLRADYAADNFPLNTVETY